MTYSEETPIRSFMTWWYEQKDKLPNPKYGDWFSIGDDMKSITIQIYDESAGKSGKGYVHYHTIDTPEQVVVLPIPEFLIDFDPDTLYCTMFVREARYALEQYRLKCERSFSEIDVHELPTDFPTVEEENLASRLTDEQRDMLYVVAADRNYWRMGEEPVYQPVLDGVIDAAIVALGDIERLKLKLERRERLIAQLLAKTRSDAEA